MRYIIEQSITLSVINAMNDRQIVATAIELESEGEEVAVLSCNRNIVESEIVSIVW
ncbi:MAG: hypothetical protein AAGA60_26160 [Cyanobacteria bacterium P01_E01_bin.42]